MLFPLISDLIKQFIQFLEYIRLKKQTDNLTNNIDSASKIFAEYGEYIYGIAVYKFGEDLADDLYQNLFVSIVLNPIPQSIQNVKHYLYRAIINDNVDQARKLNSQKKLLENYAKETNFFINDNEVENAIISEEWYSELFKIIGGQLTPNEALAIKLRYQQGRSIEQVAKEMDLKKESVIRYVSVGLKKIRQILNKKRGEYNDGF